ncbi:Hypothetical protein I5071_33070 [Sandaracinus amylolyticus]|nr:Hypothetical protein I5071_33070 [Sandaracinus amylolyticus]
MWSIEFDPSTRLMTLRLVHQVTAPQMRALSRAHASALAATGGEPFKVLGDLRGLTPLDIESASLFTELRRAAASLPGFVRRAVLTDSPTVAMQQRRSVYEEGGSRERELITLDEGEARAFLVRD